MINCWFEKNCFFKKMSLKSKMFLNCQLDRLLQSQKQYAMRIQNKTTKYKFKDETNRCPFRLLKGIEWNNSGNKHYREPVVAYECGKVTNKQNICKPNRSGAYKFSTVNIYWWVVNSIEDETNRQDVPDSYDLRRTIDLCICTREIKKRKEKKQTK